ncbi:MAG: hypothetical protein V1721_07785 [Pseudomonadota bacterium]
MTKTFIKMHGLGNDFVVFDGRAQKVQIMPEGIRSLADRRMGIGFDQMVIIDPPKSVETDAFMRIYNADGSEVGACGNATRCVAKLLMKELKKNCRRSGDQSRRFEGADGRRQSIRRYGSGSP